MENQTKGGPKTNEGKAVSKYNAITVSYTHLTLPTKRIV